MTPALSEIQWEDPIVPIYVDKHWEQEVKQKTGSVMDVMRRVSPSPWLRQLCLEGSAPRMVHITGQLAAMMGMVTAQENACRYCYGATRATMRILGYSEKRIGAIERDVQLADFNERERAMLHFTRNLARSNPRPDRQGLEQLLSVGYSQQAVAEAAYFVAFNCLFNRVSTFMAVPPAYGYERFANGILGRLFGSLLARKLLIKPVSAVDEKPIFGRFSTIARGLAGLPAASVVHRALEGAFASSVLSMRLKVLMFGVVARSLQCAYCESECRDLVRRLDISPQEFDLALGSLRDAQLEPHEQEILSWTRNTVHYQTQQIQVSTRALGAIIGGERLIEAIGVASLANAVVRLAVIME